MRELLVIVPSRGRPQNVLDLQEAVDDTAHGEVTLMFGFDEDDPTLTVDFFGEMAARRIEFVIGPRGNPGMVGCLNEVARDLVNSFPYVGFMGNDHRPRTDGWDEQITRVLQKMGTGLVYGNDLFQGASLPTAVFMTTNIVRALGYMAPPCLSHMYVDNAWKDWGEAINRIVYMPEVIIEHVHPEAGKTEDDAMYGEARGFMGPDHVAYGYYRASEQFEADTAKLRGLL